MREFLNAFIVHARRALFPLCTAALAGLVFVWIGLFAGQVHEALAGFIPDVDRPFADFDVLRAAGTIAAVLVFAVTLLHGAMRLTDGPGSKAMVAGAHRAHVALLAIVWGLPWLFVAHALFEANDTAGNARRQGMIEPQGLFATPLGVMGLLVLFAPVLLFAVWRSKRLRERFGGRISLERIASASQRPLVVVFIALSLYFLIMPAGSVEFAAWLGPISIVCLSLAGVAASGASLLLAGRASGWPFFWMVVLLPVLWGSLRLDDNNHIRELSPRIELVRPGVAEAMNDYLATDASDDDPIVFVSAEGGGIRAAQFTAATLARLADQCPRLARRVFAISGVSGGAIGAAAYRASLDVMPVEGDHCDLTSRGIGPRQAALSVMFEGDHLSPSLAKQAFPELVQMFLPASLPGAQRPFAPQTDRQRALEQAFERSFERAFDVGGDTINPMQQSVFARRSGSPWLLLNLTRTDNGADYLASPLDLAELQSRTPDVRDFRSLWNPGVQPGEVGARYTHSPDYRLSTMAATSARFPLMSPAGVIYAPGPCAPAPCRFVDGGYFDNSGIDSLSALIRIIASAPELSGRVRGRIMVLHIDSNPKAPSPGRTGRPDFDIHEVQAVIATRELRTRLSYHIYNRMLRAQLCRWAHVELDDSTRVPLRLGWILSRSAVVEINSQAGEELIEQLGDGNDPLDVCTPR